MEKKITSKERLKENCHEKYERLIKGEKSVGERKTRRETNTNNMIRLMKGKTNEGKKKKKIHRWRKERKM